MIVRVDPASAWWVRAAAETVLVLHIAAGGAALLSGAAALMVRKGARVHRIAGRAFVIAMLAMAGLGAAAAPLLPQLTSTLMGLFVCYLVVTGWLVLRRAPGSVGRAEVAALAWVVAIAVMATAFGWMAAHRGGGLDGSGPAPYYGFAVAMMLAAIADLRMIRRGGLAGRARIVRHVWRLSVALLIADFSFFIGQPRAMPTALHGSPLLFLPEIAVLATMVVWLVRLQGAAGLARAKAL